VYVSRLNTFTLNLSVLQALHDRNDTVRTYMFYCTKVIMQVKLIAVAYTLRTY